MDIEEIKKFAKRLERRDSNKTYEQETDKDYYEDKFPVTIAAPFHVVRTGTASTIVDNIVNHITVSNAQVKRPPKKTSEGSRESALKVERFLNNYIKMIAIEIKDAIFNAVLEGEGLFQVEFNNEAYKKDDKGNYVYKGDALPVIVRSIDPMIAHCSPYDSLHPDKVVKMFEMDVGEIWSMFPEWPNPKNRKEGGAVGSKYLAYYDKDIKYFEGDGIDLEQKKNVLGFNTFVHFYSGYGRRSHDGQPENLAVGRLRRVRGRLIEECEIESRIDSIIGIYANPILQIMKTSSDADDADEEALREIVIGPGATVVTGYGWNQVIYTPDVATAQLFAHLSQVRGALETENPSLLSGVPSTSRATGRQEDIEFGHISKGYAELIYNLEEALSVVLGMVLRVIDNIPQALPISSWGTVNKNGTEVFTEERITKDDIGGFYDCKVSLNVDKDSMDNADFMKNRMMVNEGHISWKRYLMDGKKMTESEAVDEMTETIAERTILTNPTLEAIRAQEAIKQIGAERYLAEIQNQNEEQGQMSQALGGRSPKYRPSEAKNPEAAGIIRQVLGETPNGPRSSPNA